MAVILAVIDTATTDVEGDDVFIIEFVKAVDVVGLIEVDEHEERLVVTVLDNDEEVL